MSRIDYTLIETPDGWWVRWTSSRVWVVCNPSGRIVARNSKLTKDQERAAHDWGMAIIESRRMWSQGA